MFSMAVTALAKSLIVATAPATSTAAAAPGDVRRRPGDSWPASPASSTAARPAWPALWWSTGRSAPAPTSTTVRRISSLRWQLAEAPSLAGGSSARAVSVFTRQPGQGGADAIMQVPAQAVPFFLAGQHEPFPGALEVLP